MKPNNYAGIDPGIMQIVRILAENGVETCQACAASGPFGPGSGKKLGDAHSYHVPTVDFVGSFAAGFQALSIALTHGLPAADLSRVWEMRDGEPNGPIWRMTFTLAPDAKPYRKAHAKCWCGAV
jgi:hypothetical protein